MGLLDNFAMRQQEKALRPFMTPDERLIEYDICHVDPGGQMPVILSNKAIYINGRQPGEKVRIDYANVADAASAGQRFAIETKSGNRLTFEVVGKPKGDLWETISHHVREAKGK